MDEIKLRLHDFLPHSQANGPGTRAVLWVQGCSLGCPGCFNPETHPSKGGELVSPDTLFNRISALRDSIEGISVSGGEPFQQRSALLPLLQRIKQETDLSVLVFTGFIWDEIQQMPHINPLLACIDILLAGRYDESQRLAQDLIGSANKTIHFLTDRYTLTDLKDIPPSEIVIMPEGDIVVSGIDPVHF